MIDVNIHLLISSFVHRGILWIAESTSNACCIGCWTGFAMIASFSFPHSFRLSIVQLRGEGILGKLHFLDLPRLRSSYILMVAEHQSLVSKVAWQEKEKEHVKYDLHWYSVVISFFLFAQSFPKSKEGRRRTAFDQFSSMMGALSEIPGLPRFFILLSFTFSVPDLRPLCAISFVIASFFPFGGEILLF